MPEELDYERSRLIYEGAGGNEVRRSILPGGVRSSPRRCPARAACPSASGWGWARVTRLPACSAPRTFWSTCCSKGTGTRTALDIASSFDAVGGESNALTAKEHTCYYACSDDDAPMAVDVITDMVTNALLDPAHLEQERG